MSDEDRGRVIYSVSQERAMKDDAKVLVNFFRSLPHGKAQYTNGVCITPTVEDATSAAERLASVLDFPFQCSTTATT